MSIGWIKLHRSLKEWEWYADIKATRLLTHLLISVNYEDKKWMGQTIKAGSLAYSWENLSLEIGLTIQQTRTAMSKLERSGEVTRKATNKYQVVTLCKWDKLQDCKKKVTSKTTNEQQTDNKQITTTKEVKEVKEEEKEEYINIAFSVFWDLYGKKKGNKESCQKKWSKLKDSERIKIIDTLPNFKASVKEIQYLPFPETYINQKRWNDELDIQPIQKPKKNMTYAELMELEK